MMTRFYKITLITLIALLASCDGKDIKPLDDIYGEWSHKKIEGDDVTKIDLKIYLDSDTVRFDFWRYNKSVKTEELDEFLAKHKGKYGNIGLWFKKELAAEQLSFYKEINGQRKINLKFKIVESSEKSMTVELLEASEDTMMQSLVGKTLIFQINRKRNKQPVYDSEGTDKKKTYFFHGGPEF